MGKKVNIVGCSCAMREGATVVTRSNLSIPVHRHQPLICLPHVRCWSRCLPKHSQGRKLAELHHSSRVARHRREATPDSDCASLDRRCARSLTGIRRSHLVWHREEKERERRGARASMRRGTAGFVRARIACGHWIETNRCRRSGHRVAQVGTKPFPAQAQDRAWCARAQCCEQVVSPFCCMGRFLVVNSNKMAFLCLFFCSNIVSSM
jgi:hypothetical protein